MTVKCFKQCCISCAVDGTDDDLLWNGGEKDGDVRRMKALTVKMETVTLSGTGRYHLHSGKCGMCFASEADLLRKLVTMPVLVYQLSEISITQF